MWRRVRAVIQVTIVIITPFHLAIIRIVFLIGYLTLFISHLNTAEQVKQHLKSLVGELGNGVELMNGRSSRQIDLNLIMN